MLRVAWLLFILVFSSLAALYAQESVDNKVATLIERLKSQDPAARKDAVSQLLELGSDARNAVNALGQALKDTDYEVRYKAAGVLYKIGSESIAVLPQLIDALKDEKPEVRIMSIEALGSIGSDAEAAIPDLIKIINNEEEDPNIRAAGLRALGRIGKNPGESVPVITRAMRSPNPNIRFNALQALRNFKYHLKGQALQIAQMLKEDSNSSIRERAAEVTGELEDEAGPILPILIDIIGNVKEGDALRLNSIQSLIKLERETINPSRKSDNNKIKEIIIEAGLSIPIIVKILRNKDENKEIRKAAIEAIAVVSPNELSAVEPLIESLKEPDERPLATMSINTIAASLAEADRGDSLLLLRRAAAEIKNYGGDASAVQLSINTLDKTFWWEQNISLIIIVAIPLISYLVSLTLYIFIPVWLLVIGDKLNNIKLPEKWGGNIISAKYFFIVGFFQYRDRVLDAWVKKHIENVRERFCNKRIVKERASFLPIPVSYDGVVRAELSMQTLQPLFKKNRIRLLICGKASTGKTSLACQVAKMGLSEQEEMRLCQDHLVIPVLLEKGTNYADAISQGSLFETIRRELGDLIDEEESISEELLTHLLKRKRILVIIDGLSEFARAVLDRINLKGATSLPSSLIVTSRNENEISWMTPTTVMPIRSSSFAGL